MNAPERMKKLNEIMAFTPEGKVIINGNDNPTDMQIGMAIRKYARQFSKKVKITNSTRFRLSKPHPKVGAQKGVILSKSDWKDSYNVEDKVFESMINSGYLMKVS